MRRCLFADNTVFETPLCPQCFCHHTLPNRYYHIHHHHYGCHFRPGPSRLQDFDNSDMVTSLSSSKCLNVSKSVDLMNAYTFSLDERSNAFRPLVANSRREPYHDISKLRRQADAWTELEQDSKRLFDSTGSKDRLVNYPKGDNKRTVENKPSSCFETNKRNSSKKKVKIRFGLEPSICESTSGDTIRILGEDGDTKLGRESSCFYEIDKERSLLKKRSQCRVQTQDATRGQMNCFAEGDDGNNLGEIGCSENGRERRPKLKFGPSEFETSRTCMMEGDSTKNRNNTSFCREPSDENLSKSLDSALLEIEETCRGLARNSTAIRKSNLGKDVSCYGFDRARLSQTQLKLARVESLCRGLARGLPERSQKAMGTSCHNAKGSEGLSRRKSSAQLSRVESTIRGLARGCTEIVNAKKEKNLSCCEMDEQRDVLTNLPEPKSAREYTKYEQTFCRTMCVPTCEKITIEKESENHSSPKQVSSTMATCDAFEIKDELVSDSLEQKTPSRTRSMDSKESNCSKTPSRTRSDESKASNTSKRDSVQSGKLQNSNSGPTLSVSTKTLELTDGEKGSIHRDSLRKSLSQSSVDVGKSHDGDARKSTLPNPYVVNIIIDKDSCENQPHLTANIRGQFSKKASKAIRESKSAERPNDGVSECDSLISDDYRLSSGSVGTVKMTNLLLRKRSLNSQQDDPSYDADYSESDSQIDRKVKEKGKKRHDSSPKIMADHSESDSVLSHPEIRKLKDVKTRSKSVQTPRSSRDLSSSPRRHSLTQADNNEMFWELVDEVEIRLKSGKSQYINKSNTKRPLERRKSGHKKETRNQNREIIARGPLPLEKAEDQSYINEKNYRASSFPTETPRQDAGINKERRNSPRENETKSTKKEHKNKEKKHCHEKHKGKSKGPAIYDQGPSSFEVLQQKYGGSPPSPTRKLKPMFEQVDYVDFQHSKFKHDVKNMHGHSSCTSVNANENFSKYKNVKIGARI